MERCVELGKAETCEAAPMCIAEGRHLYGFTNITFGPWSC